MTETAELTALRRTTAFLKAIVEQFDIDPESTAITVRVTHAVVEDRVLVMLNLGEVLREADAAIAFAPQPSSAS